MPCLPPLPEAEGLPAPPATLRLVLPPVTLRLVLPPVALLGLEEGREPLPPDASRWEAGAVADAVGDLLEEAAVPLM